MPGSPKAALTGDAAEWVADHDAYTFTTSGNGDAYRDLIVSYPHIAAAMDYSAQVTDVQAGIWDAIDAAAELGYVADIANPAAQPDDVEVYTYPTAFGNTTDLTRAEAIAVYGAKIAHALWIEVAGAVPWKLHENNEAELAYLLDPTNLFEIWDVDGATPGQFFRMCDHSPKRPYDIAQTLMSTAANKTEALGKIYKWGETYRHSFGTGESLCIATIDQSEGDKVSRTGCPSGSYITALMCRSINLPAQTYEGKYAFGFHYNVTTYAERAGERGWTLAHGDDLYNGAFKGSPDILRAVPHTRWQANVEPLTTTLMGEALDVASLKEQRLRSSSWIVPGMQTAFVPLARSSPKPLQGSFTTGWDYVSSPYGIGWVYPYMSADDLNQTYLDLVTLTGVSGLPADAKPTPASTGTEGALTPDTGQTLSTPNTVYEDKDVTGTLTVTAGNVVIRNCRINGDGGIGIAVGAGVPTVQILNCEITGCVGGAITGMPLVVSGCYIHANSTLALKIDGAGASNNIPDIHHNYIEAAASGSSYFAFSPVESARVRFNTMVSTEAGPCVSVGGTPTAGKFVDLYRNWIDGGSYAISRAPSTGDLVVHENRFGRSGTAGLHSGSTTGLTWSHNVYEDDETPAERTDSAPL